MDSTIYNIISIISLVLVIAGLLGGFWGFKHGAARSAQEVQERVINALQAELETLRERLDDVTRENKRLGQIINTICAALRIRGLDVAIERDTVSIRDTKAGKTTTARIQETRRGHSATDRP